MTLQEAIYTRHSKRIYTTNPLSKDHLDKLNQLILSTNEESGLSIQLVTNNSNAFSRFKNTYGMFENVSNYFALVGKQADPNLKEKLGYFGEKLVLEATTLGLGTCWVGGTYDKTNCPCNLLEDEVLVCVITIGYPKEKKSAMERLIKKMIGKRKIVDEMLISDVSLLPKWLEDGMNAVVAAPSAINRQPVTFIYKNDNLTASVTQKMGSDLIDLGIAKRNFEIASQMGTFGIGNGKSFIIK